VEALAPPLPAALGLAAVLGLAFFGVRLRWIAVIGVASQPPSSAELSRAAALGLVFFGACVSWVVVAGGEPEPLLPLRSVWPLRVFFLCAWAYCA
jgi:hypothetical protein